MAVISDNYWTRRFARNPDMLGSTLYVNGVGHHDCGDCRLRALKAWRAGAIDRFLDSAAEPAGTECLGQSAG